MTVDASKLRDLLAISRAVTGATDEGEILHLVVDKACALVGASAAFLLLGSSGKEAKVVASVGIPRQAVRELALVLEERIETRLREQLRLAEDERLVAVPMILRGDVRGLLCVVQPEGADAGPDDEYVLSALADQAAIALGHASHLRELETALDIVDRERRARAEAMEKLSRERSWLRTVIEASPVAILLVEGRERRKVTANSGAVTLFGRTFPPETRLDEYAAAVCTPDGASLPRDDLPAIAALAGRLVDRELLIRRPDGTTVPVLARATAIRDERGEVLGGVVLYEDIARLKELERLREEWTSIVAHDLKQPLNEISLRAQFLQRAATEGSDAAESAREIHLSAVRVGRLVSDLLDMSLVESHHLTLARQPCSMRSLVEGTVRRCSALLQGRPVTLDVHEGVPDVDVDPMRIEQVLVNLLSNAVKYGRPGTPIGVRTRRQPGLVELVVRNEGAGMSSADLAMLFTRFQRGAAKRSRTDGLGLGLYISKGIVAAHGGTMWAESEPGKATEFHFTIPEAAPRRPRDA